MVRLAFLGACLLAVPTTGLTLQSQSHSHAQWPWTRQKARPARELQQQAAPAPSPAEPQKVEASSALAEAGSRETSSSSAAVKLNQFSQFTEANKEEAEAEVNRSAKVKHEEVAVVDLAGNAMLKKWIKTGPRQSQELKRMYQNDTWIKEKLQRRCGKGNTSCAVVEVDKMLCEALELAGLEGWLAGSTVQLEGGLNATMNKSSVQFGVDTNFRSALFRYTSDTSWPASSKDDGSAFARLITKSVQSPPLKALVNETCNGIEEDDKRSACRKHAPRALFCQALAQAAARIKDSDELVPLLVSSTKLRGDGEEIMSSALYKGLPNATKTILQMSRELSIDEWLRSGSDGDRTLRSKCIMGHAMKQYVEKKCADPLSDCGMQVYDSMICGSLQRLGDTVATPDIEKAILHAIDSNQMGYDLITRRAFSAKFKAQPNHTRGPELDKMKDNADYKLAQMKKRLLANTTFQKLVSRTCVPLNRIRPSCWETTPTFLFCQALSSAASQLIGGGEVFKLMQAQKAMVPN